MRIIESTQLLRLQNVFSQIWAKHTHIIILQSAQILRIYKTAISLDTVLMLNGWHEKIQHSVVVFFLNYYANFCPSERTSKPIEPFFGGDVTHGCC